MNFVFTNDKFQDKWFESNLFVAKNIFLKQKSLHSQEFICDVTGQRESNNIKDVVGARLLVGSFGFAARHLMDFSVYSVQNVVANIDFSW